MQSKDFEKKKSYQDNNTEINRISLSKSRNNSKTHFSENLNIPIPKIFNSTPQASTFTNISDGSPRQNMQDTILKLHSIIKEKSNLIDIQKERIEKLTKKLSDDRITLSQLQQNYQEHQISLSQLQLENQKLLKTFNELKSNYNPSEDEHQKMAEMIKQYDLETDKLNREIVQYEQKIAQYKVDSFMNNDRIESALESKNFISNDNEQFKNKISELETYKEKCLQFESKIPEIQEIINQLQQEVNLRISQINNKKTQLDQLKNDNYILKKKCKEEIKILNMRRDKYPKLKLELETKIELQNEIDILQNNLLRNQQFIDEVGLHIQNEDEYLVALRSFNKKNNQENFEMNNYLSVLQEEMKKVKSQVIQLMTENSNKKKILNDNVERYVNQGIEKSEKKINTLTDKENLIKSEIKDMKKIVGKLEVDVNGIVSIAKNICAEKTDVPPDMDLTFEFSDKNFSNLSECLQNVENNNYLISSLIEENKDLKNITLNGENDECPPLPKEDPRVRAAKYGLF